MSSNIGYLKSLVDGLSRKEKVDIAKAGHHELLPVYMVIDSLKKEQEMDDALKGIEAQNNMPTREESTIRQQLLAEIGATDTSRESVREETSGIGSSGLRELPGGGAGDPMPSGYSGPSWAGKMPGGSMTAARGGVVPGYANGGFYGQQEEEDFGFLEESESDRKPFRFTPRPYGGESPSIRFPDPLGDSPFEHISAAGLPGFLLTKGKGALGLGKAAWTALKKIPGAQKTADFATKNPYIAAALSAPVAALGSAGYRSWTADPAKDLDLRPLISDSPETTYPPAILNRILAQEAGNSGGSTGIRQLADTSVSSGLRTDLSEEIKRLRSEYAKLTPGQTERAKNIQGQIQQLRELAISREGQLTARKTTIETTAAEDLASLEDRYNTKVNAVDSLYEKRTGQLEDRLQPRIDRGVASLKSNAADYDANEKAAIWFAMSKALGKRNTDPLNSGLDSIGTDLQDFRDTQADSASTMRGNLNDLEDLLQSGQISYEDAHLLATEQLGDQLFSGKRDMRDSLREGTYGYEDSLLDLTTSTQDAINTLNLGSIGDKISTELAARTLDDPYLTLLQDQLNNSERMDLATQRAMDERTQAQIEASGQNIPTREDAQAQLNYAKDLRARLREGNAPDDLEEMIEAAEDFGHYWMNFHRRASAPAPPTDFRALMPKDSTDLTPDSSIVTSSSNTFDPTKFRQHLKKG